MTDISASINETIEIIYSVSDDGELDEIIQIDTNEKTFEDYNFKDVRKFLWTPTEDDVGEHIFKINGEPINLDVKNVPYSSGGEIKEIEIDDDKYRIHIFKETGEHIFEIGGETEIDVLIVAGGGGSGGNAAGGAGAGGVIIKEDMVIERDKYEVIVGEGGKKGSNPNNGEDSKFDGITSIGGGRAPSGPGENGRSGGSGSGASQTVSGGGGSGLQPDSENGGFGNDGCEGNNSSSSNDSGAGGGGAGEPGGNSPNNSDAGNGGDGIDFSDLFTKQFGDDGWFGGGGGGGTDSSESVGGKGGGGGNPSASSSGEDGIPNTGGGAGGGGDNSSDSDGGKGGSGIVLVRLGPL